MGLIPVKPVVKENMVQAFFSFIPCYPPSIMVKNRENLEGDGISKNLNTSQTVEERTHW
jgi:hypothetical protein